MIALKFLLVVVISAVLGSFYLHLSQIFFKPHTRLPFKGSQVLGDTNPNVKRDAVQLRSFSRFFSNETSRQQSLQTDHRYSPDMAAPQGLKLMELYKPLFYTSTADFDNKALPSWNISLRNEISQQREKLVLFYTKSYGIRLVDNTTYETKDNTFFYLRDSCPYNCVFTDNKTLASSADAIIFGVLDTVYHSVPGEPRYPETERPSGQLWIANTIEAPLCHNARMLGALGRLFNMTASYRLDSDMYLPYGYFYKLDKPKSLDEINLPNATVLRNKSLAASLISNCNAKSGRDFVIQALKNYVRIDQYGRCGKKCPHSASGNCRQYIGSRYKFFLAFENSLCQDYVTEKFFGAYENGLVPVTYGLGDYSEIAPPHSYINALDFPTAEALGKYLQYLDSHDEEYLKYFHWRTEYGQGATSLFKTWCNLCVSLWETPRTSGKRWRVGEFDDWWNHKRPMSDNPYRQKGTFGYWLLNITTQACVSYRSIFYGEYVKVKII